MESSDNEEDTNAATDTKRKLVQLEDPSATSFKKARFSWQVKGSKGKANSEPALVAQKSPENSVKGRLPDNASLESSSSDRESSCRETPINNDEKLFHEMDFAPSTPDLLPTRNIISLNQPLEESKEQKIISDMSESMEAAVSEPKTESITNPASRVKHVQTSLRTCLLTGIPSSSAINSIPAISVLDNSENRQTFPRRLSAPNIAPSHAVNSALNTDTRDGIEFRDALRSMHRSTLSSYEKWQKRNTAGAIVDNVFNRTLEEMGICPDPVINRQVQERSDVEDQSILAAISSQGLTVNRNDPVDSTESRSEDANDGLDYFRQNRDVFDKTFERLGYFRYDIIHQRNPDIHTTNSAERNLEETATQTDFQLDNIPSANNHDRLEATSSADSPTVTDRSDTESDIMQQCNSEETEMSSFKSASDIPVYEANSFSNSTVSDGRVQVEVNTCTCSSVSKEKDSIVTNNVLNLALSAAIQSQGLTFK